MRKERDKSQSNEKGCQFAIHKRQREDWLSRWLSLHVCKHHRVVVENKNVRIQEGGIILSSDKTMIWFYQREKLEG